MLDVNAMDNAAVDEAIAGWLGYVWEQITEGLFHEGEWMWKIPQKGTAKSAHDSRFRHELPSWTTDPRLTGDMLYGDEANGEPGLWSRHGIALVYKSGWQLIIHIRPTTICYGPFGQGDTDEERKCSAVARAYLLLIDELKGGSAG